MRPDVHLVPLPLPSDLDAPDAWLLLGMVDAVNAVQLDTWGVLDEALAPAETLARLRDDRYHHRPRVLAVEGPVDAGPPDPARVLGVASLSLARQDDTRTGYLTLHVRPEHRRQGIGSALHDRAVEVAREHGRSVLTSTTYQATEPAPTDPGTLAPSTGTGRVRADDPDVLFARRRGWELEQVARRSVLDVPLDPVVLAGQRAAAESVAGPDYRVVTWVGRCPDDRVADFAALQTRMSTDAPSGGLEVGVDTWDVARVRATEDQHVARGMTYRVAAAEHVPTGRLAAFTALVSRPDTEAFVHQDDTLVVAEHRGRRLGMLVKAVNLERLAEAQPAARRVGTWNAEENGPMLAINVALGFRAAGGAGEWQRRIG